MIPPPDKKSSPGHVWAYDKISDLLVSPILERVLNRGNTLSFSGTILARLNRAELGDTDCAALAHFLISRYKYTVVVPDFGFYGRKSHISLIRQNRLIAGVNFLDESPLKNELLLIDKKSASRCTLFRCQDTLPNTVGFSPIRRKSITTTTTSSSTASGEIGAPFPRARKPYASRVCMGLMCPGETLGVSRAIEAYAVPAPRRRHGWQTVILSRCTSRIYWRGTIQHHQVQTWKHVHLQQRDQPKNISQSLLETWRPALLQAH